MVAASQETKWFGSGSEVYKVGDSVLLMVGREVASGRGVRQSGEGVAIVFTGPAVHAWEQTGYMFGWYVDVAGYMCYRAVLLPLLPAGETSLTASSANLAIECYVMLRR